MVFRLHPAFFYLAISASLFFLDSAQAFELPAGFEEYKPTAEITKQWLEPKSYERVSLSQEDASEIKPGRDAFAAIQNRVKAKGHILGVVLNIKNWQITSTQETRAKKGSQLLWFFGNYVNSTGELTHFVELYILQSNQALNSYLFTRSQKAWSLDEIVKRFKVDQS